MIGYLDFPSVLFLFLSFFSILMAFLSIRRAFKISRSKSSFWNTLGGYFITIAGIFIATTTILITLSIREDESNKEEKVNLRDKVIKELVQWEAVVTHIPSINYLDIELYCYKTEHTLVPKTVNVFVEIIYQDEYSLPASRPVTKTFRDLRLLPISEYKLSWHSGNLKDIWDQFKDKDGNVANISVLDNPLSINFNISYNLDLESAAQAAMYPEFNDQKYLINGLTTTVVLKQISPSLDNLLFKKKLVNNDDYKE